MPVNSRSCQFSKSNLILGFGDKNTNVNVENHFINLTTPPPFKKKAKLPMYSKLPCEFTLFTKTAETTLG